MGLELMEEWLRWFGNVLRSRDTEVGILKIDWAGTRGRGESAREWKNVVEIDMRLEMGMTSNKEIGGDESIDVFMSYSCVFLCVCLC